MVFLFSAIPQTWVYTIAERVIGDMTEKFVIFESLPHGERNAVTAEQLVAVHGLTSARDLRRQVHSERMRGALIASGGNGYYVPETRQEISTFLRRYESMGIEIFSVLKTARQALNACENGTDI